MTPGENPCFRIAASKNSWLSEGKKLRDVKGNHASLEPPGPPCANKVGKVRASIFGGALSHTAELVGMNEVQVDHIELAPVGNHLLDELA